MSYWSPKYDVPISMTFFRIFHRSGRSRINMGVDRIILLIAIIGIVENQAAPYASGRLTCGDLKRKYLFVLEPAANQIELLTDLVKSTQSAIVKRPGNEGDPVEVVVSSEHFKEFEKKSQALKVYRSHSLQCVDQTVNITIVETNNSRSALPRTGLSEKIRENSLLEATTPLTPKTQKKLHDKMCRTASVCEQEFEKNLITGSMTNDVNKLVEATASSSPTFVDSSTSRIVRASRTMKGISKTKSKVRTSAKFPKGRTRAKPKERIISKKVNNGKKSAKKFAKTKIANRKTTSTLANIKSTHEPWKKLMSIAAKSLTKSSNTYTESKPRKGIQSSINKQKLLSSAKPVNATQSVNAKEKFSNRAKRPKAKNTRKPAQKHSKSLNARNRENRRKSLPKSQGRKKLSPVRNPKTPSNVAAKNRKPNRNRRELKISADTTCIKNNSRKRSLGHLAKRDFSFRAPGGCTVIKISTSCDGDCSENNEKNSGDSLNFQHKDALFYSPPSPELFAPIETPTVSILNSSVMLPVYPNEIPEESIGALLFSQNENSDTGTFEEDAVIPQSLRPTKLLSPDYESQEEYPQLESVAFDDHHREKVDKVPTYKPSMITPLRQSHEDEYPWYKPSHFIPPSVGASPPRNPSGFFEHRPSTQADMYVGIPPEYSTTSPKPFQGLFEVPMELGEDYTDDYDEDDEAEYDDDDDDENGNYEKLEVYEEEKTTESPPITAPALLLTNPKENFLVNFPKKNNIHDSKGEDAYQGEKTDDKDEDYDIYGSDYEDEDDDDEDYVEESGNGGIIGEDDYDAEED